MIPERKRGIRRITSLSIAAAPMLIAAVILSPATATAQDTELTALRGEIGVDPEPGTLLAAAARLSIDRMPLSEALVQLAQTSRIQIAFSPSLLPPDRVVDCACATQNVARTLDRLLDGTELGYVELGAQVIIVPRAAGQRCPWMRPSAAGCARRSRSRWPARPPASGWRRTPPSRT